MGFCPLRSVGDFFQRLSKYVVKNNHLLCYFVRMLAWCGFASSPGAMDRKTWLGEQWIFLGAHPSRASGHLSEPLLGLAKAFGQPIVCLLFLLSPRLVHRFCSGESSVTLSQSFCLFCFVLSPWMKIAGQDKCLLGATVTIAFLCVFGFFFSLF